MTCSKGHYVPDKAVACPACTVERGNEALYRSQLEFLRLAARDMADGKTPYPLRVSKGDRHVVMYESHARTFCGVDLKVKPQIKYEPYGDATLATVCAGCRIGIARAVEEAMAQ